MVSTARIARATTTLSARIAAEELQRHLAGRIDQADVAMAAPSHRLTGAMAWLLLIPMPWILAIILGSLRSLPLIGLVSLSLTLAGFAWIAWRRPDQPAFAWRLDELALALCLQGLLPGIVLTLTFVVGMLAVAMLMTGGLVLLVGALAALLLPHTSAWARFGRLGLTASLWLLALAGMAPVLAARLG